QKPRWPLTGPSSRLVPNHETDFLTGLKTIKRPRLSSPTGRLPGQISRMPMQPQITFGTWTGERHCVSLDEPRNRQYALIPNSPEHMALWAGQNLSILITGPKLRTHFKQRCDWIQMMARFTTGLGYTSERKGVSEKLKRTISWLCSSPTSSTPIYGANWLFCTGPRVNSQSSKSTLNNNYACFRISQRPGFWMRDCKSLRAISKLRMMNCRLHKSLG